MSLNAIPIQTYYKSSKELYVQNHTRTKPNTLEENNINKKKCSLFTLLSPMLSEGLYILFHDIFHLLRDIKCLSKINNVIMTSV